MKETEDMKQEMYVFMEEQTKLTSEMRKQLNKLTEEFKRKSTT